MSEEEKVAVVVGVGPGLGLSVGHRFAREDYDVALLSRSEQKLEKYVEDIEMQGGCRAHAVGCDATDPESVEEAFERVDSELGAPDVLVYNAGMFEYGGIMELDPETFQQCWQANCYGGFLTARQVLPQMAERGEGTIIFTGATASKRGSANFAGLAVGKFGLRALAQSMAREFGPRGVHVAHAVIDGQIDTPQNLDAFPDRKKHTFLDSDEIAEQYWQLHCQDRTTWTLELDLRPYVEDF